jgi:hypothetical protein
MTDIRSKIQDSDAVVFTLNPASLRGLRLSSGRALDTVLFELSTLVYTITGDEPTVLKNRAAIDRPLASEGLLEALEAHGVETGKDDNE